MEASEAKERIDRFLIESMEPQGWWPYRKGNGPSLEATAWSSFALMEEKAIQETVLKYLLDEQNDDGGWSTAPDTGFSDWVTGPVLMTLRSMDRTPYKFESLEKELKKAIEKGLLHLSDSRPVFYPVVGRLLLLLTQGPKGVHFERGWPWDPECFHWVEPTSYHLLALKVPGLPGPEVFQKIVNHANKYILTKVCKGGGWNYGNRKTLGAWVKPFRVTTAEALLALQDENSSKKAIKESISHLTTYKDQDTSTLGLAWSIVCLHAYKMDFDQELSYLIGRQKGDGRFTDNNVANALSSLALSAALGENRLKFK